MNIYQVLLIILSSALVGCGNSENPQNQTAKDHAKAQQTPMAQAGLEVHIDPSTGKPTPIPPSNSITDSYDDTQVDAESLPRIELENGAVGIDIRGHFQTPLVATIDCEGKVKQEHKLPAPWDASRASAKCNDTPNKNQGESE